MANMGRGKAARAGKECANCGYVVVSIRGGGMSRFRS